MGLGDRLQKLVQQEQAIETQGFHEDGKLYWYCRNCCLFPKLAHQRPHHSSMNDLERKKARYLRDEPGVRLGGIAANLARVRSFGQNPDNDRLVRTLLGESRFFIEWAAADADLEVALELLDLQREITRWLFRWPQVWGNEARRQEMVARSKLWSDRLLARSGLL